VLADYLTARHPRYIGLTGTRDQVETAKRAYHVFVRRADELDDYAVPHTSFTFLMDPAGTYLTHFPETLTPPELAEKLSLHLDGRRQPGRAD
jgi:protein SCO1/2